VKNDELKIADWARSELRREIWAKRRDRLFRNVRGTFILLLMMAVFDFAFNHQVEIQSIAFAKIHNVVMAHSSTSDRLRQNALNYEQQVDDIAK